MVQAVAIYTRISSDDGTALGVARQEDDCRELAERLGWPVAEVYEDNDYSAYLGKPRPEYERMLSDIAAGTRDAVLCYHSDRLTRDMGDLLRCVAQLKRAGVRHLRFVSGGDVDVASGDGMMELQLRAVFAAEESAAKSRRVKRKLDQVAAEGRPHGGNRSFGFEANKVDHRPEEAEVIRTVAARYIAGESLNSLVKWLNDEAIPTVHGGMWRTSSVRLFLRSARIAGLRIHRGQVVGPGTWEPMITPEDRDRILARFDEKARTGRRPPQKYLLSGLVRCAKCKHPLYSAARNEGNDRRARRYVCKAGSHFPGCGRLTVVAEPLEDLITDAVLFRLDTPELADALSGKAAADAETAELSDQLGLAKGRKDELAGLYAAGAIDAREWMAARNPIESEIHQTEQRLARLTRTDHLVGLVGNGAQLRREWADIPLTRKHAIVTAVLDHVTIAPGTPGARRLDRDRVDPVWRL